MVTPIIQMPGLIKKEQDFPLYHDKTLHSRQVEAAIGKRGKGCRECSTRKQREWTGNKRYCLQPRTGKNYSCFFTTG